MKIMITTSNGNIEAQFSPRFGRCAYFIGIDTDSRAWEAFPNPAAGTQGGAGPQAVQFIADQGIEAVISGRYGLNAYSALEAAGIRAFIASQGPVDQVLEEFMSGELEQVSTATGPELHGGRRHG